MEYKFIATVHGPAVLGENEVLFFNQFQPLLDYYEEDPEFLIKAKLFIADSLRTNATILADSLTVPQVGSDLVGPIHGAMSALNAISQFEHHFLPSIFPHLRK